VAAQQMPCDLFGFSLVPPQFADALRWDGHGHSITAFSRDKAVEQTPHPSRDGWRKRRRGTPSPQGRGQLVHCGERAADSPGERSVSDLRILRPTAYCLPAYCS
jgi:hypothetical protein